MRPRDDNPEKYCDNVRKSWQIMYEVVRQIDQECFIAHLEPFQGVGYDCLSLVVSDEYGYLSEHHGYVQTKFMLNRNGQNGTVGSDLIRDIWGLSSTEPGVKELANRLIEFSGLSRLESGESQSVMFRVCEVVTRWISEQPGGEFCVAPPGWPGGCRVFDRACNFLDGHNDKSWPSNLGEPYLSLGVRHKELARIRMTDATVKFVGAKHEQ